MNRNPSNRLVGISKFLSLVLRHKPETIGIKPDAHGWVAVEEMLSQCKAAGTEIYMDDLLDVVENSEKKRFSLSANGKYIRAAQGHSIVVALDLPSREPPSVLYHGTATRFLDSIIVEGIKRKERQQVHLAADRETALRVGQRHGKATVLEVAAVLMYEQGFQFFLAENGVWLTDQVPPEFLCVASSNSADSATTSRQPKLST